MGKEPFREPIVLVSTRQLADRALAAAPPDASATCHQIARWVTSYLMAPHPELGRPGEVCPFTGRAYRLDTIRIGVSPAASGDTALIKSHMEDALRQFSAISCDQTTRYLRTVIVGFPNLNDENGVAALKAGQDHLKLRCLWRGLMVGRFHPASEDRGLWNRDFRPMRSPIPLLAIRHLVRNDAAFALRNPVLLAAYVCRYALAAPKQLLVNLAKQRARREARIS
jgi:hypothetical protein